MYRQVPLKTIICYIFKGTSFIIKKKSMHFYHFHLPLLHNKKNCNFILSEIYIFLKYFILLQEYKVLNVLPAKIFYRFFFIFGQFSNVSADKLSTALSTKSNHFLEPMNLCKNVCLLRLIPQPI